MRITIADENGEEIPGVEGLVEAIEHFELKRGAQAFAISGENIYIQGKT